MKKLSIQKNKGFTLIETMIAVFILVMAMNGLLGLIASSLFSARYAKNDITANYLIQEAIDSIRNDRDTVAFQQKGLGGGWNVFLDKYGYTSLTSCFRPTPNDYGCQVEPAKASIIACSGTVGGSFGTLPCQVLNYDSEATYNNDFYTYDNAHSLPSSNFKRQIKMSIDPVNPDELDIKVTVEWQNGNLVRSRSSRVSLLNW